MDDIYIFYVINPKSGKRIAEGHYSSTESENGLPAMQCAWKGTFFSSEPMTFVFAEHVNKFTLIDAEESEFFARNRPDKPKLYPPGIIGIGARVATAAIRHAKDFSGTKGFAFTYTNSDNQFGLCWAMAPAAYVDEIAASIPQDRVDPRIKPWNISK
jgi:hypothetical protein